MPLRFRILTRRARGRTTGREPGIVLYKIDGAKMVGDWTLFGAGGVLSKETLTRIPGDQIPDSFHREIPQRDAPPRDDQQRPNPRREAPKPDPNDVAL